MSIQRFMISALAAGISVCSFALADTADQLTSSAKECTSRDYRAMEARLEDNTVESTPAFNLSVMETFVSMCPYRIERPSVARRAARAALDVGDPNRALALYQIAIYEGAAFDRQARLDYIATLIETGSSGVAWSLLDQEVARWLGEIDSQGFAQIKTSRLRDGLLHHVSFSAIDPDFKQSDVWLAMPFSGGWPAAIVLGADQKRVGLRKLVKGNEASGYEHLDFVRCRGRTTLTQNDSGLSRADVGAIAEETAKSYLRNPDLYYAYNDGEPVGTCFDPHRLFVSPDPYKALPRYGVSTY